MTRMRPVNFLLRKRRTAMHGRSSFFMFRQESAVMFFDLTLKIKQC